MDEGIFKCVLYQERLPRHEYRLTQKGADLFTALNALRQRGDQYLSPAPTSSPATRRPGSTTETTLGRGSSSSAAAMDHVMPPSVNNSNAKHYKSNTITEYHEFPGRSHWTCGEPGWEEIADYGLDWAVEHAGARSVTTSA